MTFPIISPHTFLFCEHTNRAADRLDGLSFDAIVIGAGRSGLTAAAYLARGGAHVLVCEQNSRVGRLFNSFWRGGYVFDSGIKAVENSAVMMPIQDSASR